MEWVERTVEDDDTVLALSRALNHMPVPLARYLVLQGVTTFEAAREYFRNGLDALRDPLLLADMDRGADRLARAVRNREQVLVYGDFDVDGITSITVVVDFLRRRGLDPTWYLPSRFQDSHGFHLKGIERAQEVGASLIVVVDCGTNDTESAELAAAAGIDVLICDHHENAGRDPVTAAHINPMRAQCGYPFKAVSACTLAYRLIGVTCTHLGETSANADSYLDLVALSTVCDVMPLVGENRVLVREGISVMRKNARPGLAALMRVARVEANTITADDLSMRLGPRLNAPGRMGRADLSVHLLSSSTSQEADKYARDLDAVNRERRSRSKEAERAADRLARIQLAGVHNNVLVLFDQSWHPGVLGPAASRIVERFSRPTVLLTSAESGTQASGSARSLDGVNIHEAITTCTDILSRFGGHAMAAGVRLNIDDIAEFRERLDDAVRAQRAVPVPVLEMSYDADLPTEGISAKLVRLLGQCEPFGKGNRAPVFRISGVRVREVKLTADGYHLKLGLFDPAPDGIAFRQASKLRAVEEARVRGASLDLLCNVQENHWQGSRKLQLNVKDIHIPSVQT